MRVILSILLLSAVIHFCKAQSYEIYNGDTINRVDASNQKQGYWRITGKIKKLPGFKEDQLVEEGNFVNNKREGLWKEYYNNGKQKNEITYKNNLKFGYARTFYKSGALQEEGNWMNGKWDGSYKLYYENGQLSYDWQFNNGKREGQQKYYYENGRVNYDGTWKDGSENGILKEYNKEGQLIAEKKFNAGKIDEKNSKFYTSATSPVTLPATPILAPKNDSSQQAPSTQPKVISGDSKKDDSVGLFNESGYHKLMNPKGQVAREGIFNKGKLIEGKIFQYAPDGKLKKTIVYKNGVVVQVIDEE